LRVMSAISVRVFYLMLLLAGAILLTGCPSTSVQHKPAKSNYPVVGPVKLAGQDLQFAVYNTSKRTFSSLEIFIRGSNCEGRPATKRWKMYSRRPLYRSQRRDFRKRLNVMCERVTVTAYDRGRGSGKHLSKKRKSIRVKMAVRILYFRGRVVRFRLTNLSSRYVSHNTLIVARGTNCSGGKDYRRIFLDKRPLAFRSYRVKELNMSQVCNRIYIKALGIHKLKGFAPSNPPRGNLNKARKFLDAI